MEVKISGPALRFNHHNSLESLQVSARAGCRICRTVDGSAHGLQLPYGERASLAETRGFLSVIQDKPSENYFRLRILLKLADHYFLLEFVLEEIST